MDRPAAVGGGLDAGQPEDHGGPEDADAHGDGQGQEAAGHDEAGGRRRPLRAQVELENGQRQEVGGVGQEAEEGALERLRIEADRTLEDQERQRQSDPEEPDSTHHEEEAQRPSAVRLEVPPDRGPQRHGGEDQDQDGVEGDPELLRDVGQAPAQPDHVQAGQADREGAQHVEPAVPAVEGRDVLADLGHELDRPAQDDEDGGEEMDGDDGVADGVAGDVPMRHEPIPRPQVPAQHRARIEGGDGQGEQELADDGGEVPEASGSGQGSIGDRRRPRREAVGQDRGGHTVLRMGMNVSPRARARRCWIDTRTIQTTMTTSTNSTGIGRRGELTEERGQPLGRTQEEGSGGDEQREAHAPQVPLDSKSPVRPPGSHHPQVAEGGQQGHRAEHEVDGGREAVDLAGGAADGRDAERHRGEAQGQHHQQGHAVDPLEFERGPSDGQERGQDQVEGQHARDDVADVEVQDRHQRARGGHDQHGVDEDDPLRRWILAPFKA